MSANFLSLNKNKTQVIFLKPNSNAPISTPWDYSVNKFGNKPIPEVRQEG